MNPFLWRLIAERSTAKTGEGNRRSVSSPAMIIDLFGKYLDDYGHEDLSGFDRIRFHKEWNEDNRFCDTFGPATSSRSTSNSFSAPS